MYFDHSGGGEHPPERTEAVIHASYRKLFSLVKSMMKPDDIARAVIIMLQGLFGADGAVMSHVYDDGARFVAAVGSLSHMVNASIDMNTPSIMAFFRGERAIALSRKTLSQELLALTLNARFESMLVAPIAINGLHFGLICLVSNRDGYFEDSDAATLYELMLYLSMLLENRIAEIARNEKSHCERLGDICRQLAPGLHSATIELIQTFAQMRKFYVDQKYTMMAAPLSESVAKIENMAKRIQDLRTLGDVMNVEDRPFERVELRPVIENVISYEHAKIEEVCALNVHVMDEIPAVRGDFTMIWQALHEIVSNALRAMSRCDGPHELSISAYPIAGAAVIEIKDTGLGIEPSDAVHIFEPFFTTWKPCSGLGLARAHVSILRLGGTLAYYPNTPRGAVFRISLPNELYVAQAEVF